jgi:hypothetical protein
MDCRLTNRKGRNKGEEEEKRKERKGGTKQEKSELGPGIHSDFSQELNINY